MSLFGRSAGMMMAGGATEYLIDKSLRFNKADSPTLYRTPGVAGNRKTTTISFWMKRSELSGSQYILCGSNTGGIILSNIVTDSLEGYMCWEGSWTGRFATSRLFRDPSAWYHIVVAIDTTLVTAGDRVKVYINGARETSFSTWVNPSQNADSVINGAFTQYISTYNGSSLPVGGYLSDFYLIDGQQLTPSSFGQTDSLTGVWVPKAYSGSYGTCGCKLTFKDNSSTTALGYDTSGVGNHWTTSGFSVTPGVTNDSVQDTPTNNYCTLNPIWKYPSAVVTNGSLDFSSNAGGWFYGSATFGLSSGKWYWEEVIQTYGNGAMTGIIRSTNTNFSNSYLDVGVILYNCSDGNKAVDGVWSAYGNTWTTNDVIGIALDMDNGKIWFSKNNTWQASGDPVAGTNAAATGLTGTFLPLAGAANNVGHVSCYNFGQRSFTYTPPTGFKSLCTQNLPTPTIQKSSTQMDVALWTGNGTSQSVTLPFQPDLVWLKNRPDTSNYLMIDSVRGGSKEVHSNDASVVEATDAQLVTSFNSGGFSVGNSSANTNTKAFVGWCWKKGATPGFDIVTFTGTGANLNVNHSLGVAPAMIIIKGRDGTPPQHFWTWHQGLAAYDSAIFLNLGNAVANGQWNNIRAASTSTQFFLGTDPQVNRVGWQYVTYLFAEVPGFSKFGTYTGNGSTDGPFVYLGFRPKFLLTKMYNAADGWILRDGVRSPYNSFDRISQPDVTYVGDRDDLGSLSTHDFLSNGVKFRGTGVGNSSGNFVYMAFAETPFKYALAR